MTYPMGMPVEHGGIPDGSPHQWMSGDYMGPMFEVRPQSAVPNEAEANAAVAASGGNRDGGGVLDVPNMSNPGTHSARS